jgi:aspartyl aminopeptidase
MRNDIQALMRFLNASHSVYHAVAALKDMLTAAGYTQLQETETWSLTPGGKYYLIRGGSALMAFRVPKGTPTGFLLSAAHSDRPAFKLKENGELTGTYTRLATEKYGGMVISTWLDRPLSVAGRVLVETETGVQTRLVDIDRDLLLIPNVAIHMNRNVNDGYAWNPAVDTLPLLGGKDAAGKLQTLLEEAAGGKILSHDLYLYVRQKSALWGVEEEYLSAQGVDDLLCAWGCAQGFLAAGETDAVPVLCVFDNEEIGSASAQGADSQLLPSALGRICRALNVDQEVMLRRSFMISADNAHAVHPNHPEYADATNAPVMNGGVVLKFNANLRYATDGVSAAVFRQVCKKADVPMQTYYNRADILGGSTLGSISVTQVTVPTADIGLPQLAMHSCYETAGVRDIAYLEAAMTAYYGSNLSVAPDGTYTIQ